MAARYSFLGPSLRAGGHLIITCPCGREVAYSAGMAISTFGYGASPQSIRARMRCTACGKKGSVGVRVE
jgi:hypothetical protein